MDSVYTHGQCILGVKLEYSPNCHNQKPVVAFNVSNIAINENSCKTHSSNECSARVRVVKKTNNKIRSINTFFSQILKALSIFIFLLIAQLTLTANSLRFSIIAIIRTAYRYIKTSSLNFIPQVISNMIPCSNKPPIKSNIVIDDIGSTK